MMKTPIKEIINKILKPSDSLSQRMISGGFWVFLFKSIEFIFSFIQLIIVARILSPQEFGLIGIAYLTINVLNTFTQIGFKNALIQKKESIGSYLNSAWTVSILRALLLYFVIFFIAPLVAIITYEPQATSIIQIISLSIVLQSFININTIFFIKELKFKKQFIYTISGLIGGFIFTVVAVILLQNVWALVIGQLFGDICKIFVSYLMNLKNIPKFSLDWKKIRELFVFGKWISGSVILIFLITQGDDIFVALFLGTTALGLYQMAYKFSNLPATQITHTISQVSYPTYSKLQDDQIKLKNCYFSVLKMTSFFTFPIAGILLIVAPEFIEFFLGEQWLPMVSVMQILCIFGVTRSLNATTGPLFQAVGKPKILAKLSLIQLILILIIIFPFGFNIGLIGVSFVVTISNFLTLYLAFKEVSKIIGIKKREFIFEMYPLIISIILALLLTYILKLYFLNNFEIWMNLLCSILIGGVTYIICAKIIGFSIFEYLNSILIKKSLDF